MLLLVAPKSIDSSAAPTRFFDYFQYATIVVVENDLPRRLVFQTVIVAIPGFA